MTSNLNTTSIITGNITNTTNITNTGYIPPAAIEGNLADVLGEGTAIAAIIVVTVAIIFLIYRKVSI